MWNCPSAMGKRLRASSNTSSGKKRGPRFTRSAKGAKNKSLVGVNGMPKSVKLSLSEQQSAETTGCPNLATRMRSAFRVIAPDVQDEGKIKTKAPFGLLRM